MGDKVLFVEPAKSYAIDEYGETYFPMRKNVSLSALAILGSLESKGIESEFVDMAAEGYGNITQINENIIRNGLLDESILEKIAEVKPCALLISSMATAEQENIINPLISKVKKLIGIYQ